MFWLSCKHKSPNHKWKLAHSSGHSIVNTTKFLAKPEPVISSYPTWTSCQPQPLRRWCRCSFCGWSPTRPPALTWDPESPLEDSAACRSRTAGRRSTPAHIKKDFCFKQSPSFSNRFTGSYFHLVKFLFFSSGKPVSNGILMSCQLHWVSSGRSNSCQKQMHISKLLLYVYHSSSQNYRINSHTNI